MASLVNGLLAAISAAPMPDQHRFLFAMIGKLNAEIVNCDQDVLDLTALLARYDTFAPELEAFAAEPAMTVTALLQQIGRRSNAERGDAA
jgi:hypothetical protein